MANVAKQKTKLKERIEALELELKSTLHKKGAGPAINVSQFTTNIQTLKKQLAALG